jgi:integrase
MAGVLKKKTPSGKYRAWYMVDGKQKWLTGTKKKKETLQEAQRREALYARAAQGIDSPMLQAKRRRNTLFGDIRNEYIQWGQAQGGRRHGSWGATHERNRRAQLAWWEKELSFVSMADLEGIQPDVEKILRRLQNEGLSNKTLNNYAETLQAFCRWSVDRDYLDKDPLRRMRRFDESTGTLRRAMTEEEIHRLLTHCEPSRRLLYEVALETGLRANELRSLAIDDLGPDRLHLHKEWTKNRKDGYQPISEDLVKKLEASAQTGEALTLYEKHYNRKTAKRAIPSKPLLYVPSHTARSLELDLDAAGIPKLTKEGKVDFHSLRVTFTTLLVEEGVNIKELQTLARHSTPQITLNIYARVRPDNLSKAVGKISSRIQPEEV